MSDEDFILNWLGDLFQHVEPEAPKRTFEDIAPLIQRWDRGQRLTIYYPSGHRTSSNGLPADKARLLAIQLKKCFKEGYALELREDSTFANTRLSFLRATSETRAQWAEQILWAPESNSHQRKGAATPEERAQVVMSNLARRMSRASIGEEAAGYTRSNQDDIQFLNDVADIEKKLKAAHHASAMVEQMVSLVGGSPTIEWSGGGGYYYWDTDLRLACTLTYDDFVVTVEPKGDYGE